MPLPLIVGLVSLLLFGLRINSFPLKNWDEAWYAEIIRNLASGKYNPLVAFWNGRYYFDKPPLYFWLSAPIVKIFGDGEWTFRLVSVIAAAFSVTLVFLIAKKLYNQKAGLLSALIFICSYEVYVRFSEGNLDALLICFSLLAFYFYLRKERRALLFSGFFIGLAVLTKGFLLGGIPLMIIFLHSLITKSRLPARWHQISSALILIVPWLLLGFFSFGTTFINWYVFHPAAGNLSGINSLDSQLILDMGLNFFVWWLFLIPILLTQKFFIDRTMTFFFVISFAYLFSFYFSLERYGWYLLPVYPYLSIALGSLLVPFLESQKGRYLIILAVGVHLAIIIFFLFYTGDRSILTATAGQKISQFVNNSDSIIFDDPDFANFLFYSRHGSITVSLPAGPKPGEWWIIPRTQIDNQITQSSQPVWLVTPYNGYLEGVSSSILDNRPLGNYFSALLLSK